MEDNKHRITTEQWAALGEAMQRWQETLQAFSDAMSVALKLFAENNLEMNNDLEHEEYEIPPAPEPKPVEYRRHRLHNKVYIVPQVPLMYQLSQYPGGRVLATANHFLDIAAYAEKQSPETVRIQVRQHDKQPWALLDYENADDDHAAE